MNQDGFQPCRVEIEIDIPARPNCEVRLQDARTVLHLLNEKVLGAMSVLYEGDNGKLDHEDAQARFKVRGAERDAIVQARVEFIDGYPERDATHNVGTVRDRDPHYRGRNRVVGWWREAIERYDNVEKVFALVTCVTDGYADDHTTEELIWEKGAFTK